MGAKAFPANQLIGQMSGALRRLGFTEAFKSETGSRYFTSTECRPFQLRISDHQFSGHSRRRQEQVVKSVALKPFTAEELPGLALELAIGFLIKIDLRRGLIGSYASRKTMA